MPEIFNRCQEIRKQIPDHVTIVAAAKTRTPDEINQAVDAGINIIGENYVQEAEEVIEILNGIAQWHMIGHLQRNKAKKAVELFDMIETLDSMRLARAVDKRCAGIDKIMPVLVEINSGRETN
ncbi:YggS family pyridoxal phosphate-dependent enzyme, partial [Candidatus Poribacteria bacterium]|nr:YggS family pyridoxal phosphate-dependent enzyme [Candidatus Poribacteria bacterium]